MIHTYKEKIYAGVLGKCLGVYMGRPVEGWFFDRIDKAFGEIYNYKNEAVGAPLIVPDDDISGTFAFFRALEDHGYPEEITAEQIGNTWLNYLIEDKTILWWGGLGRSTEHSAYLRLKDGIPAPESGSIDMNGRGMAEAIGAQIFIDAWALANPGRPDNAVKMARAAGSVSHDGIAVDAACFIAALEALAFIERDIDVLLDNNLKFIHNDKFIEMVQRLRAKCAEASDWHEVRDWIAACYGYEKYPGNCPVVTNHLVILMALIMGGDDFHKALMIAVSAGWDTDCNAGNVGCINGVRLGLAGVDRGVDLRGPVADRLFVVTADGGTCVSDTVTETRKIVKAAAKLYGEKYEQSEYRYQFEYPGSVQGFQICQEDEYGQALYAVSNEAGQGLELEYLGLAPGSKASVSVETYIDKHPKGVEGTSYFEVFASPNLYPTQMVKAMICSEQTKNPDLKFFIQYYNEENVLVRSYSETFAVEQGENLLQWQVPENCGQAIYSIGIELVSEARIDGSLVLKWMDWRGAPKHYRIGKSYEITPALVTWTNETTWLKTFVSSARNFYPDYLRTFSVSHPEQNGVATTGGPEWSDYKVTSSLTLSTNEGAGMVIRTKGHRRYYSGIFQDGQVRLCCRKDWSEEVLAAADYDYELEKEYQIELSAAGNRLVLAIDGKVLLEAEDTRYSRGGAGFVVHKGGFLADGFTIEKI